MLSLLRRTKSAKNTRRREHRSWKPRLEQLEDRTVLDCAGPDGFGYRLQTSIFENINLEPGQAGVFTILNATDDDFAVVNLGSNTFSYYGQAHTRLFASSNGLITFGNGNAEFGNSDLTTSPQERSIAVLWDDWIKNAGAMILGKFDGDRLIIEWNSVRHFGGPDANVTFQAVLQLNTGGSPGMIWFNYVDLNAGDPAFNNGAGATVGIKDQNAQGANRLLVSFNNPTPYLGSNRAQRLTTSPATSVVSWTGAGGDFDWNNRYNWSSCALPGPSNNVVIDVPGNVTIEIPSGTASIRSLTSQEAIRVSNASLSMTANSVVYRAFDNISGLVQVQAGTLRLAGGGTSTGTFVVSTDATLNHAGGGYRHEQDSQVIYNGTVAFTGNGDTTNIAGTYNSPYPHIGTTEITIGANANFSTRNPALTGTLWMNGGGLLGSGDVTVFNRFTWRQGGILTGSGTLRLEANGQMFIEDRDYKVLTRTISNRGTAIWAGTGGIGTGMGVRFENEFGAVFEVRNGESIFHRHGEAHATFVNRGTFRMPAGAGTFEFTNVGFVNDSGLVQVQAGTLRLAGGGTSTGTFVVSTDATLDHGGGTFTHTADSRLVGPGRVVFSNGRHIFNSGTLDVSGVTIGQSATLSARGAINAAVQNAGRLDVGGTGAAGVLVIVGSYQQTVTGVLNIELSGWALGTQYDFLFILGTASLNGTLNIIPINGFCPAVGDLFIPLYATGGLSGNFAVINGLDICEGRCLWPFTDGYGYYLWTYPC